MLTIRPSQSCCWFFDVARHTPINRTHSRASPTVWGVRGPAGPSEAPPGVPEKYRKKRIIISARRLFVPGVPFLSKHQQDLHAYIWRKRHSWTYCRPSSGLWYAEHSRGAFIQVTESARTTPWGGLESGQHFRRWSTFDTALLVSWAPRGSSAAG